MQISLKDWMNFKDKLAALSEKAADQLAEYVRAGGGYVNMDANDVIAYASALVQKYGEGAGTLAATMYDAIAELEGAIVPPAEVADVASYGEVAKAIRGAAKTSTDESYLGSVLGRMVKRTGADTTLNNAIRDGAEFAWVPSGDTCAFCLTLASRGWQKASKKALKNGHAEHIHANCDCTYAVRFDGKSTVAGYDPDKYLEMYRNAEGNSPLDKINSMRRMQYGANPDKYREQSRKAYAQRKLKANEDAFYTFDFRDKNKQHDIIKPHNIINNLRQTGIGRRALDLIHKNEYEVRLVYGDIDILGIDETTVGICDKEEGIIYILADKTNTIQDAADTTVHEAYHLDDYGDCQKSEIYCEIQAMRHHKNGISLTQDEVNDIIKHVKKEYHYLPWEVE